MLLGIDVGTGVDVRVTANRRVAVRVGVEARAGVAVGAVEVEAIGGVEVTEGARAIGVARAGGVRVGRPVPGGKVGQKELGTIVELIPSSRTISATICGLTAGIAANGHGP